jgi:hypothetical protein
MSGSAIARVHLEMRAERELVQLARLVVTGLATVAGMGLEEAEDCRAAVDEMVSSLLEVSAEGSVLSVDIEASQGALTVRGGAETSGRPATDDVRHEISGMILQAVTDRYSFDVDADAMRASFEFERSTREPRP